jgi:large subunit ribosomal protein L23
MGLLDRWAKKQAAEPNNQGEPKNAAVVSEEEHAHKARKLSVKKTSAKKAVVDGEKKEAMPSSVKGSMYHVLVAPLVTEKSAHLEHENTYVFLVESAATKPNVIQAVKEVYGVKPLRVNMVNVQGKAKRSGRRLGRRSDYKKALVTLPHGTTIAVHEGV